jgi:hypothetical protein
MAENKTVESGASVEQFLDGIENATRRDDAHALAELMSRVTGRQPKMWGDAIVGFGKYRYKYDSGREGEMLRVGFSPRNANFALYLIAKDETYDALRARLGKHKTGGSCLYINKLADVDLTVLETMVASSWQAAGEQYGSAE